MAQKAPALEGLQREKQGLMLDPKDQRKLQRKLRGPLPQAQGSPVGVQGKGRARRQERLQSMPLPCSVRRTARPWQRYAGRRSMVGQSVCTGQNHTVVVATLLQHYNLSVNNVQPFFSWLKSGPGVMIFWLLFA